ncbi:MAG: hypothetical protein AB1665_09305 [Candidatus Thermoplasmatota archaeon]
MISWEHGAVLAAILAFIAFEMHRHPRLRRHLIWIPASTFVLLR